MTQPTFLYNLKKHPTHSTFLIAKFDEDFNVLAVYNIVPKGFDYTCDCPANNRTVITKPCRHRRMMKALLPVVDTGYFYDPDTDQFCAMLGDHREPPEGPEAQPELVGEAVPLSEAEVAGEALGSSIPAEQPLVIQQYDAASDVVNTITPAQLVAQAIPTIRRR